MSNLVALENLKQGAPPEEWGLSAPPNGTIEGFTSEFSVSAGEELQFKIDTDASAYRIDIYRLGYYGGDGARLIESISHDTGATSQPDPNVNTTTGLVDAGNWSVTDTWTTPSDLVSGVYIAKLVRLDGTFGESHVPFVIRNDSSSSDIVLQTDDTTWQAYNSWGGHSLYDGSVAVSYNRPFSQDMPSSDAGVPDTNLGLLFSYTYPAIRWLEQNGYDVSYISGIDTARDPTALLDHKMFISAGHDEYWSGTQRANVEAARDAGVNLAFWGGNDVYWRTWWEPSVDGTQDFRTLISYKTGVCASCSCGNPGACTNLGNPDPSGEWTGLWRDLNAATAYGIKPENNLTGTFYMVFNSESEGYDLLVVDFSYSKYALWRNTSVADLQPGESIALGDYLGYEWNVDPLNSSRPNGLIHLSSTTAPIAPLPGPGSAFYNGYQYTPPEPSGYATHNLTLYRAESGALVFSAGTIAWAWALDEYHSGHSMPSSVTIQQAMVNLLADMGVSPETVKDGLIVAIPSTDDTEPIVALHALTTQSLDGTTTATLSGTALDLDGTVAGVQVSTDGGNSWRLAIGTESWSYTWETTSFNIAAVRVAAIDDAARTGYESEHLPRLSVLADRK